MKRLAVIVFTFFIVRLSYAEDGYRLWLRYDQINDAALLQQWRNQIAEVCFENNSPTLTIAKNELIKGLEGLLGKKIFETKQPKNKTIVVLTNPGRLRSLPEKPQNLVLLKLYQMLLIFPLAYIYPL